MKFLFAITISLISYSVFCQSWIIVVRHGVRLDTHLSTQLNSFEEWLDYANENQFDWWNMPLAPMEVQNVLQETKDDFLRYNLRNYKVIISPYRRAIETVDFLTDSLWHHEIIVDQRLGEWAYASFGRMDKEDELPDYVSWPRSPWKIEHEHQFDNLNILKEELSQESELKHLTRLKAVLMEHVQRYQRVVVVGHNTTVGALFLDGNREFHSVSTGGYATFFIDEENRPIYQPELSRGVQFH